MPRGVPNAKAAPAAAEKPKRRKKRRKKASPRAARVATANGIAVTHEQLGTIVGHAIRAALSS